MTAHPPPPVSFESLNLLPALVQTLEQLGYEAPSPVQAQAIPHLLAGHDILGHAPTGTGKTAAFALPLLSRLDLKKKPVQIMVLAPTRELAIQVAEAFKTYAANIKGFQVLPIYGGQDYGGQIRGLKRGVHVVVGTPGRVMDHMRKGTLKLDQIQAMVLDEADEMLRMGFIDEVQWILEQTPDSRQMALFSATMPKEIEKIARRHLREPQEVSIKAKTATAETIRQRFWLVGGMHKLDALTRILEVEPFDGVLIFVRTKIATTELAEKLEARGHAAAAMNGDMPQKQREQMVNRLKAGGLDILIATDVAARGLDVDRISHVINYDIPYDTEAYIHRIGRTGRAGRQGDAILFVAPRERRMLGAIERATRKKIEPLTLPSTDTINNKRIADFKQRITDTVNQGDLAFMRGILEQYQHESDLPPLEIAAALATLSLGKRSLLIKPESKARSERENRPRQRREERGEGTGRASSRKRSGKASPLVAPEHDMELFRIDVGHVHEVQPRNIVGAIANEAGLDAQNIGRIDIRDDYSIVELPIGMPKPIFADLKKAWVCGRKLNIVRVDTKGNVREPQQGTTAKKQGATAKKKGSNAKTKAQTKTKTKTKDDNKLKKARAIQKRPLTHGSKKRGENKPTS
ncbi:MAG: DEAD/DEAH box helicase [Gammaproteobacteria bacterium]